MQVLIFFLVCSLAFERCVEWLKHKLKQKGRLGLVVRLRNPHINYISLLNDLPAWLKATARIETSGKRSSRFLYLCRKPCKSWSWN